ncbi:MAG: SRPBCC family protein [Methanosarcinales archaeon]
MTLIEKKIKINASPLNIWTFLEDVSNWHKYLENIKKAEIISDGGYEKGALIRFLVDYFGVTYQLISEITEFEKNKKIAWKSIKGPKTRGSWTLKQLSDGTTGVTLVTEYEIPGSIIGKFFDKSIANDIASKNIEFALKNLKKEVYYHRTRFGKNRIDNTTNS